MDADNPTIRWSSNAPSIVSVVEDSTDIVTIKGVQEGNAIIKAAATDGSGVEATCNVVVKSKISPYPENADLYVPSVKNYKIVRDSSGKDGLELINEDGDTLRLGSNRTTLYVQNLTKGSSQSIDLVNVPIYVIGSLEDKSYITFKRLTGATEITSKLYFNGEDELFYGDVSIDSAAVAIIDERVARKLEYLGNIEYSNSTTFNYSKNAIRYNLLEYYDNSGVKHTIDKGSAVIVKANIINGGNHIATDYYYADETSSNFKAKIQVGDNYVYLKKPTGLIISYELATESDFPSIENVIEITMSY